MCGPKFCSMHHSRTIEEGIARMAKELEERESLVAEEPRVLAGVAAR
jgi:hypothetical protein